MKKLLFVIESLNLGGAEKSLVTLLNLLDYSKYEVDLLLFAKKGEFLELVPPQVNLLPVPSFFKYSQIPWSSPFKKFARIKALIAQVKFSLRLRKERLNNIQKPVWLWRYSRNCVDVLSKHYDVAIAYAQGLPTFFVADKVHAEKKIAWINATYLPKESYLEYIRPYYKKYDYVNAVSESVAEQMQQTFGIPQSKTVVIKDILDVDFAQKMSCMQSAVETEMKCDCLKILTVGRLAFMKGYDLAIGAAKILKDKGIAFKWFVIGEGDQRKILEQLIAENGLQNHFVLLGSRSNPYPYFKNCDLYVQSSKFEGFGITLAEAKMFRKPIVTTNFDAVGIQFQNEVNGLIVDVSAEGLAAGIERMFGNVELRSRCVQNLALEKVGNKDELDKFYKMISKFSQ